MPRYDINTALHYQRAVCHKICLSTKSHNQVSLSIMQCFKWKHYKGSTNDCSTDLVVDGVPEDNVLIRAVVLRERVDHRVGKVRPLSVTHSTSAVQWTHFPTSAPSLVARMQWLSRRALDLQLTSREISAHPIHCNQRCARVNWVSKSYTPPPAELEMDHYRTYCKFTAVFKGERLKISRHLAKLSARAEGPFLTHEIITCCSNSQRVTTNKQLCCSNTYFLAMLGSFKSQFIADALSIP